MDLDKIREFHRFAQTLSFTQAAHDMHTSLSTLSKHIQYLEDELDVSLVNRGFENGHNTLTVAGRRFLARTHPWLDEYDDIVKECRDLQAPTPPVRIHGTTSCIINVTSQLHRALAERGIMMGSFTCVDAKLPAREALDQGLAEFACYYEAEKRVRWLSDPNLVKIYGFIPLAPVRPCFIAAAGNPFGVRRSISLPETDNYQIITMDDSLFNNWLDANTEIFEQHGYKRSFKVVHDSPLTGGSFPIGPNDLVLSTDRFARYYEDLDVEDVVTLKIEDFDSFVYPFLIYRKQTKSPAARKIIDVLGTRQWPSSEPSMIILHKAKRRPRPSSEVSGV